MDIWQWVTQVRRQLRADGQVRLAELIDALPTAVCENAHSRVDAMYPEALALAKATGNPWLEVFVRHWNLQSRILHRHEVAAWMGEAVSLVEFASRAETRGCPQSVCVTQDLVNCYGNLDGPGFAKERVAATEETLARIDARWPCFRCIGGELVEALLDGGEAEAALVRLDGMEAAIHRVEGRMERYPMGESRVAVLRRLGRYGEALALVDRLNEEAFSDDDSRLERQVERAWLLSLSGRDAEALAALPAFELLGGTHSLYGSWSAVMMRLAGAGVVANDGWLDRRLRGLGGELAGSGAVRQAFELTVGRGLLAVARGRRGTAVGCLAEVDRLIPRLRRPLDATEKRAGLAGAIDGMGAGVVVVGADPGGVLAGVGGDPEVDLEVLDVAVARWPEVEALVLRRAGALAALGEGAAAEGALRAWLAGHPGSGEARVMLAQALVERGAWEEARSLAGVLAGGGAPFDAVGRGLLIRVAQAQGDVGEARRLLEAEVVASPEDTAAAMSLAGVLHSVGDSAAALGVLDRVAARSGAGPWDVWRLVHGTLLDRWETVRDAAGRLGLVVPGSGAVEGEWEVVRVRIEEADGSESVVWARRTGPVSARVLTMEGPGRVAHYRDEVVFDPRPLAEEDEGGFGGDESGDGSSHGSGAGAWEDEWEGDGMEDGMADGMEGDGSERQAWDGDDSEDGAGDEGGGEGEDEGGDEAGEEFERPLLYAAMAIKRPGGFRVFSVDGLHPGEDELGELYMALEDLGAHPRVMSGPEYRLVDPKSGEARPAVYLYVAVEVERMRALDSALALFGARWGTPLVWPELLGVVGAKRRLEAQHAVMEAWGM